MQDSGLGSRVDGFSITESGDLKKARTILLKETYIKARTSASAQQRRKIRGDGPQQASRSCRTEGKWGNAQGQGARWANSNSFRQRRGEKLKHKVEKKLCGEIV